MRWFLTTSFEFVDNPKWTFDEFDRVHDNHYLHIEQFNALYEED